MLVPRPVAAGNTAHHIPEQGALDDFIHPFTAIQHQAEAAVDGLADAHAAAIVQRAEAHAPGRVSGIALHSHVRHHIAAILDIGRLPERRVRTAHVVMIPAHHHRTDPAFPHQFIEAQRDADAALGILVKDAGLGAHHHLMLFRVANPVVIIPVLIAAVRVDARHSRLVRLDEVLVTAAQAYPAEGSIAVVKKLGPHDILHVGRQRETILFIDAIFGKLLHPGVIDSLQEGIPIIEEIGSLVYAGFDERILTAQALIDQGDEFLPVPGQHGRALGKGQALRAVAPVVDRMAGGLVAHEVHLDIMAHHIFQQIHDIAVIGDGNRRFGRQMLLGGSKDLLQVLIALLDPALLQAGLDAGGIHLRDDAHRAGNLRRLGLCTAHAAQARAHEQMARQVAVVGNAQMHPACVQQGIIGSMHDALGPDVHPAAGGHLAVVGHTHFLRDLPVLLVVEHAHHEPVGKDDPGSLRLRREKPQRMAGFQYQRLLVGHHLQVFLDEPVLQPVMADTARLPIGHQLVGIEPHLKIQIVLDHDLEGLALQAVSLVFVDGLSVDAACRAPAIGVDAAVGQQFLQKFRCRLLMQLLGQIAQRILQCHCGLGLGQVEAPAGCPADARHEFRHFGKNIIQLAINDCFCHGKTPFIYKHIKKSAVRAESHALPD